MTEYHEADTTNKKEGPRVIQPFVMMSGGNSFFGHGVTNDFSAEVQESDTPAPTLEESKEAHPSNEVSQGEADPEDKEQGAPSLEKVDGPMTPDDPFEGIGGSKPGESLKASLDAELE